MLPVMTENVSSLRASILSGQQALESAARAMSDRWEERCLPPEGPPVGNETNDDAWTPRRAFGHSLLAADHMIGYPVELARREDAGEAVLLMIDDFMNGREGYDEEARAVVRALESADAAISLARSRLTPLNASLDGIQDRHLELPAEIHPVWRNYLAVFGFESPSCIRTVLAVAACHLHDHANQIARVATSGG